MADAAAGSHAPGSVEDLNARLAEAEQGRLRDKEEMDNKFEDMKQKFTNQMKRVQERMKELLEQKDQKLNELEACKADLESQLAAHSAEDARQGATASSTEAEAIAKAQTLEDECRSLRAKLQTMEEPDAASAREAALREEFSEKLSKMKDYVQKQNLKLQELEAARADLQSQLAARSADAANQGAGSAAAAEATARAEALEEECRCLKNKLQEREEPEDTSAKEAALRAEFSDKLRQAQEKMREVLRQKDLKLQELEGARADLEARLAAANDVDGSDQRGTETSQATEALEAECRSLRARLEAMSTAASANGAGADQEQRAQELHEEVARVREESEAKLNQVVKKTREHVKQVQAKLESSLAENRNLEEKYRTLEETSKQQQERFRETEEAFRQQQEKVAKYKQLMAQANARIEESDSHARDLREALSKAQSHRMTLQEQMGSMEKIFHVAPSREEIQQRGGILLAVENDNDDVWCLINECSTEAAATTAPEAAPETAPPAPPNQRWWLLSQLDIEEKPIPLQRRWKGEVSALRAQMMRFKKKSDDVQEEFESYKQKASAALNSSAQQTEEIQSRERRMEQLGEQLQATSLDLQHAQAERTKVVGELGDTRKRLQEANSQRAELELQIERRLREAGEAHEAALERCRLAAESQKEAMVQDRTEKERSYQEKLNLLRAQKESLDEEVEGLRARLASRLAAASTQSAAEQPSLAEAMNESATGGPSPPAEGLLPGRIKEGGIMPTAADAIHSQRGVSASSAPHTEDQSSASGVGIISEAATSEPAGGTLVTMPPGEPTPGLAVAPEGPVPPPSPAARPSFALHDSLARQDLLTLRSQVRQLEQKLEAEKSKGAALSREAEQTRKELREVGMQRQLHNTVGQEQQMEYIRNVFKRFVETLPVGSKENEQLIPVLMTFFKFQDDDCKAVQGKRSQARSSWLPGWR